MPPSKNSPYRLQVEGKNDKAVITHVMLKHGFDWDDSGQRLPYIHDMDGVDRLLDTLPTTLKSSWDTLGIVLDADGQIDARWHQVIDRLRDAGWTTPDTPATDGTILKLDDKRLGIWVMPDNSSSGAIERFVQTLVPVNDTIFPLAESSTILAKQNGAPFGDNDHLKATVHTWLAWQDPPGMPYGTAISARILQHDSDLARRFVQWMMDLFILTPTAAGQNPPHRFPTSQT